MVDDNIVSSGVNDLVIVKEEDVVGDIRFDSRNELRLESDLWGLSFGKGSLA